MSLQPQRVPFREPDFRCGAKYAYVRPHLREFLNWLFSVAAVGVWTSRIRSNADRCLNNLMTPEQRQSLHFVYTQENSLLKHDPERGFERVLKPLDRLFVHTGSPCRDLSDQDVFVLDDTMEKLVVQTRKPGCVLVSSYIVRTPLAQDTDDELIQVRARLSAQLSLSHPLSATAAVAEEDTESTGSQEQ